MINSLRRGEMPSREDLSRALGVALVKKQGVLRQPPACWTNDPKINPRAAHLLWAAVLLGRRDEIITAAGVVIGEVAAKPGKASPGTEDDLLREILDGLPALAPTEEFRKELAGRVAEAWEVISPPTR